MKARKYELSLLIAVALPIFICTHALAATPAGKITDAEGEAEIIRKGAAEPEIVQEQMDVFEGDALETGEDGIIRVALADGSSLTLAPEGHLKITRQLYDAKKGERESLFDLLRGKIRAEVAKLAKITRSKFEVHTPTAVAGVRGTDFEVEHDEAAGESGVYVFEGSTDWKDAKTGESLLIQSGYFCRHRAGRKLLAALLSDDERARRRAFFVLSERAKRRRLRRIERRHERREDRQERREERREDRQERREDRRENREERREDRQERKEDRQENRQERREEIREDRGERIEERQENRQERREGRQENRQQRRKNRRQ